MSELTPGQLLKTARDKAGLSIAEVAQYLRLTENIVTQLEADSTHEKLPATFVRGYLNSYSQLLGINADEVLAAYEQLKLNSPVPAEGVSFKQPVVSHVLFSVPMAFLLILLILSTMIALWWQHYQPTEYSSLGDDETGQSIEHPGQVIKAAGPIEILQEKMETESDAVNHILAIPSDAASTSASTAASDATSTAAIESTSSTASTPADDASAAATDNTDQSSDSPSDDNPDNSDDSANDHRSFFDIILNEPFRD